MKKIIKSILERYAAPILRLYQGINNRRIFRQKFSKISSEVASKLYGEMTPFVLSGPFEGLKYLDEIVCGPIMPKWLGSFECELHPIIKQIQNTKYSAVINVGCAEGYYAVGLAKLFPEVQVFGFDIDPLSRRQTRKLAKLNSVFQNLTISGRCDHKVISSLVANHNGPILMICDIEGAEIDLLNPLNCGSLHEIDILVEIHDMPGDNRIAKAMAGCFSQNHTIEIVKYSNRENWVNQNLSDPVFGGASREWLLRMTDEYRVSGQTWLWMICNKKC